MFSSRKEQCAPQAGGEGDSPRVSTANIEIGIQTELNLRGISVHEPMSLPTISGRCYAHREYGVRSFGASIRLAPYTVDFVCLALKLVVEVDGKDHANRRGTTATIEIAGSVSAESRI